MNEENTQVEELELDDAEIAEILRRSEQGPEMYVDARELIAELERSK